MGALVPAEELKDILLCMSLEQEPGPCFLAALLFLDNRNSFLCLSVPLFLHSLTSLISNCLNMLFGVQEGLGS